MKVEERTASWRAARSAAGTPSVGARRSLLVAGARFVLPFLSLLALWAAVKAGLDLSDQTLASPADVLRGGLELIRLGVLPAYVSLSLGRIAVGAGLATIIGVPIGLLLGLTRYGAPMFEPFLRFFQAVSGIAWLPLAIVWFGFTDTTIQIVILYTALVPIIFNTMMGVRLIPSIYRESIQTMGGGRLRLVKDVYLPGALASIVVGLRLGIGYGWRALIAGEMLIGAAGLGFMVFDARRFHLIDQILAGMIVIGILYLIIDRMILAPVERITIRRWGVLRA
jgi:taurine transport system permease protein